MKIFKQKGTILILWMTFVTVVIWIVSTVYHITVTSTISDTDASAIIPIDPGFDTATINKIKSRETAEPLYKLNTSSLPASPTPVLSQPSPTPEANPTPALEATVTPPSEILEEPVSDENIVPPETEAP